MKVSLFPFLALSLVYANACSKSKFSAETTKGVGFSQVDQNAIQFGEDDVFRIGDGTSGIQSACAGELKGYDLKGSTYFFQFEVLEDNNEISLTVDKICGVDRADMTFISLASEDNDAAVQAEISVPTDASNLRATSWSPFQPVKLNKGLYSVVVRSKNTVGRVGPVPAGLDEFDDFIIGKLNLTGTKSVKAIKVYAE